MSVNTVENSPISEYLNSTPTERKIKSDLGKDDFLNLLVTQLKYQDPLNPMEDKDFIAQMAQFSSLEQMRNISNTMSSVKAFNMIGKEVSGQHQNDNGEYEAIEGVVESVKISGGKTHVIVDGKEIDLSSITNVNNVQKEIKGDNLTDFTNLIGRNVLAHFVDSESSNVIDCEGFVTNVKLINSKAYTSMDNVKLNVFEAILSEDEAAEYTNTEDYLNENINKEITIVAQQKRTINVSHEDESTGEITYSQEEVVQKATIRGTLKSFEQDDAGNISVILDNVTLPASNVIKVGNIKSGGA